MQRGDADLRKFAADLKAAQNEDAKRREWKKEIVRGVNFEQQLELGKAIEVYKAVLDQDPGNAELRKRLDSIAESTKKTADVLDNNTGGGGPMSDRPYAASYAVLWDEMRPLLEINELKLA